MKVEKPKFVLVFKQKESSQPMYSVTYITLRIQGQYLPSTCFSRTEREKTTKKQQKKTVSHKQSRCFSVDFPTTHCPSPCRVHPQPGEHPRCVSWGGLGCAHCWSSPFPECAWEEPQTHHCRPPLHSAGIWGQCKCSWGAGNLTSVAGSRSWGAHTACRKVAKYSWAAQSWMV